MIKCELSSPSFSFGGLLTTFSSTSWRWTSQKGNPSPIPADYNTSHPLIDTYNTFVSSLPARRQQYSPILVHSTGIHYSELSHDS